VYVMYVELDSCCEQGYGWSALCAALSEVTGNAKISLSRTGFAAANSRDSRQRRTKVRCADVKHEPEGSRRKIADLMG